MQAVWYESKGPASEVLRIGGLPVPKPGPTEVLVRVMASAVNPSDTKARSGWGGQTSMRYARVVPHQDGAGMVEDVGERVPRGLIGQRVWLYMAQWQSPWGTAAQYTLVPAAHVVPLPAGVTFEEGACLGIPALTAHRAVTAFGGVQGRRVLIQGGAGAVGFYAVQMAKLLGAEWVAATAGGEDKIERAKWAGADAVIDRRSEQSGDALIERYGENSFDRIVEVDLAANLELDARLLAPNGVIASFSSDSNILPALPFRALQMKDALLYTTLVYTMPEAARQQAIADVTTWIGQGRLKHQIYTRLGLQEAVAAHLLQESGKALGKIILEPWGGERAAT